MFRVAVFFVLAVQVIPLFAHDTWILPDRFVAKPGERVVIRMTSGMEFPKLDYGVKPDRVDRAALIFKGGQRLSLPSRAAEHSLDFSGQLKGSGVAVVAVELQPKDIELKPQQVQEYLDEIGADASLRNEWANMKPHRWREIYTKHAKTLIATPRATDGWQTVAGMRLEFVLLENPMLKRGGEDLRIELIEDRKALANFAFGMVREGEPKGTMWKTDADGRATIKFGKPGSYLLRATHVRRSARPDADWESDFSTLTIGVK